MVIHYNGAEIKKAFSRSDVLMKLEGKSFQEDDAKMHQSLWQSR